MTDAGTTQGPEGGASVLRGRAWTFGRDIDTDLIIPARYLNMKTAEELAQHVMEDADPTFPGKVKPGDIVVAKRISAAARAASTPPSP